MRSVTISIDYKTLVLNYFVFEIHFIERTSMHATQIPVRFDYHLWIVQGDCEFDIIKFETALNTRTCILTCRRDTVFTSKCQPD